MNAPARILFLPWDEKHNASARCRMFDVAGWLRARGWNVETSAPVGGTLGPALARPGLARRPRRLAYRALQFATRAALLRRADDFDIVVLQRELYPYGRPWMEDRLVASATKVIFDLDDALHLRPSHFRAASHGLHDFAKAEMIARRAHTVVVSSASLENWARPLARQVVRIPTAVDTARFHPQRADASAATPLVVGWTGTAGNLSHLESIRPALEAAAGEIPFILRIVGETEPPPWHQPRTEFVPWELEREAREIAHFDVGLMPLIDSEYARAKAGYKALVYMASGVPPVVSPVGANQEILTDGVEGFFAETQEEWRARILELLQDVALRRRMGQAARARVVAERSAATIFPCWESLLESLAGEAP